MAETTTSTATDAEETAAERKSRMLLGGALLSMGTLHFVAPKPFERLIPSWLGNPTAWVYASGVWELLSGLLLCFRRTRNAGSYAAAATMVAVFPGNIKMAADTGLSKSPASVMAWGRLPLQVPMIVWALRQRRA